MDSLILVAVLCAAALHAGWNAVVKVGLDRFSSVALISVSAGIVSAPFLPFMYWPKSEVWPWLALSCFLHTGYKLFLIQAYRAGDLGQVYPIARGTAPLLVALVAIFILGEAVSYYAMAGIGLLILGIWLMSFKGSHSLAQLEFKAVTYALVTSLFIASYSLTDGLGARLQEHAQSYVIWLFVLDGLAMAAVFVGVRRRTSLPTLLSNWRPGLIGGAMSMGAYGIVTWAMTMAPIALVTALRETSVLFASLISIVVLKERVTLWRIAAASLILIGILATQMR